MRTLHGHDMSRGHPGRRLRRSADPHPVTTRTLAWGLIVLTVSGCSSWQAMPMAEPAPGAPPAVSGELRIRKLDGEKLTLHDWAVDGDSVRGTSEAWVKHQRVTTPEVIALSDLKLQDREAEGDSLRRVLEAPPVLPEKVRVHLADGTALTVERPRVDGDSLRGLVTPAGSVDGTRLQVAFALKDVQAIQARRPSSGRTVALILGVTILVVAAAVGIWVAYDSAKN